MIAPVRPRSALASFVVVLILLAGASPPALASGGYPFSVLKGDLAAAYPRTYSSSGFTLHYQPGTYAASHIESAAASIRNARDRINAALGVTFRQPFDVYLAGALFAPPDQAVRGWTFSADRRFFVLYDGSGTDAERNYMLAHELTHLIAWHSFGRPRSALVSEGIAVRTAETYLRAEAFIPARDFCLAYRRAGRLPSISARNLEFGGHLLYLDVYEAAGCFVDYLVNTYGMRKFDALYDSLAYSRQYGRSLADLERAWLATLDADPRRLPFDAARLPEAYDGVARRYQSFFDRVSQGSVDQSQYRTLDQQRIRVLQGELD